MTLKQMYEKIDGNYESMAQRLRKEERIQKFVLLFLKDQSYETFLRSWEQKNIEEAFRAVHTLKGVSLNLSFDRLFQITDKMTEVLRVQNIEEAIVLLPELQHSYETHVQAILEYVELANRG